MIKRFIAGVIAFACLATPAVAEDAPISTLKVKTTSSGPGPLPIGASTSAKQDVGNTTLATIATNTSLPSVGSANAAASRATVGVAASIVLPARAGVPGVGRVSAVLINHGPATIYIGFAASVTPANGVLLPSGASFRVDSQTAIYAVSAVSGNNISIAETW